MERACWYCPYNSRALLIPVYNCACALLHFQANKTSVHYPPRLRPDVLLHKYTTLTLWDRPLTGAVSQSWKVSWLLASVSCCLPLFCNGQTAKNKCIETRMQVFEKRFFSCSPWRWWPPRNLHDVDQTRGFQTFLGLPIGRPYFTRMENDAKSLDDVFRKTDVMQLFHKMAVQWDCIFTWSGDIYSLSNLTVYLSMDLWS
jgi:hypothetical protein